MDERFPVRMLVEAGKLVPASWVAVDVLTALTSFGFYFTTEWHKGMMYVRAYRKVGIIDEQD